MTAPNLRDEVRTAMALRELAGYVPVDTRRVCPSCGERCCVLMYVEPREVAGRKPAPYELCGACWIEENR